MQTQTKKQKPKMEEILRWIAEGVADATDGCRVELDGTCEHGCESWLLKLEMI